ncbi:MAG TPA: Gfo/Idh/MocA family oxidoreductase [Polyangiaceae bacterium]
MIRWGIIGCGDVTERKSGPAFQKVPGSALVAVMRRNGELAADYAKRHGVPRWYDDAAALIADREVDAVYVATPPAQHCEYAIACARAGKPAYVEKPMARTHDECERMNRAFADAGVPLYVAYYRRALPRFVWIKEQIDAGAIGTVRFVRVLLTRSVAESDKDPATLPWRVRPELSGGGRFVDLGCHTLDLLDHLLGPVAEVSGVAVNQARLYPAEDAVAFHLRFESGAIAAGLYSFAGPAHRDEVEIAGDRGSVRFATFEDEPVRVTATSGSVERTIAHPEHIQEPMIRAVVDELRGVGSSPSTGESAARTSWVIDRILEGYRAGMPAPRQG